MIQIMACMCTVLYKQVWCDSNWNPNYYETLVLTLLHFITGARMGSQFTATEVAEKGIKARHD